MMSWRFRLFYYASCSRSSCFLKISRCYPRRRILNGSVSIEVKGRHGVVYDANKISLLYCFSRSVWEPVGLMSRNELFNGSVRILKVRSRIHVLVCAGSGILLTCLCLKRFERHMPSHGFDHRKSFSRPFFRSY